MCVAAFVLCVQVERSSAAQSSPVVGASSARSYQLYAADGRVLTTSGPMIWLDSPERAATESRAGLALEPASAESDSVSDGDLVRIRSRDGRYLTRVSFFSSLTRHRSWATEWEVVRTGGEGTLEIGDSFSLRSQAGSHYLSAEHPWLSTSRWQTSSTIWSLGCHFVRGPFTSRWDDEVSYDVAAGERAANVVAAIEWLKSKAYRVELPQGEFPLIVWDDPTLAPEPTVAYLMIDTLWAAKALRPYEPELAAEMEMGLLAAGWYGNGLADTLFHGYPEPAHRTDSADVVHGSLLDSCVVRSAADAALQRAQIRVPEQAADPAWTAGNSAQFVDSAVYSALNDFWNGEVEAARARVRDLIVDGRSSGADAMFWDVERWVMVDQASRCDYDAFNGGCSAQCPTCTPCSDGNCYYANAAFKLGLVLYSARVMGMNDDPSLATHLAQIDYRLWEGQAADGGVPHLMFYIAPGYYLFSSGATGEATAIATLANTAIVAPRHGSFRVSSSSAWPAVP